MSDATIVAPSKVPEIQNVTLPMLTQALALGWSDFKACPLFSVFFGAFYVIGGILIWWVTRQTGEFYWLFILGFGFPLLGPFAAVGLYEISRCREMGGNPTFKGLLSMTYRQRNRQFPSLVMIIVLIFMFWTFAAHMVFGLFLGLSAMTNVMSSYEVFFTSSGITMLVVGSIVGGLMAMLVFAITVMGLPLLLDRELDFVTAMIVSFQTVAQNFVVMLVWAAMVVGLLIIGMIPFFLGLLVVFPVLGHATWHLYRLALRDEDD